MLLVYALIATLLGCLAHDALQVAKIKRFVAVVCVLATYLALWAYHFTGLLTQTADGLTPVVAVAVWLAVVSCARLMYLDCFSSQPTS
jgi:hypothetical protein